MSIEKPLSIKANPQASKIWDELTEGREFGTKDLLTLKSIVYWALIAEESIDEVYQGGQIHVAYENNIGDIKELPQIGTLKKATAEMRALKQQLGIGDETPKQKKVTPLEIIQTSRARKARAAN